MLPLKLHIFSQGTVAPSCDGIKLTFGGKIGDVLKTTAGVIKLRGEKLHHTSLFRSDLSICNRIENIFQRILL